MQTFAQINAAIQEEMQLDPGLISDAERLRFINDGLSEIGALQILEKVTETTTSDQYPTPPTGLLRLRALYTEDVRMSAVSGAADTTTTGTPYAYIVEAGAIRLYPIPGDTVTLRWEYTYTPAEASIVTDTSIPDLPVGWDGLLVDYACYRAHRKNGNYLSASQYKKDFDTTLASRIRERVSQINSAQTTTDRHHTRPIGDYFPPIDAFY